MTIDDRLDVLGALWTVWGEHGQAMTEEQWRQPTRLGDWDVRSLYAHAAWWPAGLAILVGRVRDTAPTHESAAVLLRLFNAPDGPAHTMRATVAAGARDDAARYDTVQLIERFTSAGSSAIADARRLGPVVVDYFGQGSLRLDEAISIGILEATVHLLDLQRALELAVNVPVDGLVHTALVLAQIAAPVEFIEAATGRSTADLFPLLS